MSYLKLHYITSLPHETLLFSSVSCYYAPPYHHLCICAFCHNLSLFSERKFRDPPPHCFLRIYGYVLTFSPCYYSYALCRLPDPPASISIDWSAVSHWFLLGRFAPVLLALFSAGPPSLHLVETVGSLSRRSSGTIVGFQWLLTCVRS
jgi:hypothetical protein